MGAVDAYVPAKSSWLIMIEQASSQILYGTWLLQKIGVCEHSPDVESSVICIKLFVISHIST